MLANHSILPLLNIRDAIEQLALFDDETVRELGILTGAERSFNPHGKKVSEFALQVGLPKGDVRTILGVLRYLYDRLKEHSLEGAEKRAALEDLLSELEVSIETDDGRIRLLDHLSSLLEKKEIHDNLRKRSRLERGVFPNAQKFKTYVDIRPDFNEDASEIRGFIPVVTFSIETDSTVPQRRNIRFQVPTDSLEDLEDCIARLKKKISLVNSRD